MSFLSTFDATKLMGAAADKFAPVVQGILDSAATDEQKLIAVAQTISAAWLSEVHAELQQANQSFADLKDAFKQFLADHDGPVTISFGKKEQS